VDAAGPKPKRGITYGLQHIENPTVPTNGVFFSIGGEWRGNDTKSRVKARGHARWSERRQETARNAERDPRQFASISSILPGRSESSSRLVPSAPAPAPDSAPLDPARSRGFVSRGPRYTIIQDNPRECLGSTLRVPVSFCFPEDVPRPPSRSSGASGSSVSPNDSDSSGACGTSLTVPSASSPSPSSADP